MNNLKQLRHSLALLAAVGAMGLTSIASAHDANCPYCKLKLVQSTKDQDNEVVLKFGNKRIEYRCMYCVIKDQKHYKGDLIVYAPSEKLGEPVILKRIDGKWTVPEGTVFINTFKKHVDCSLLSRAFINKAGFDAYVKSHGISDAKALTLDELSEAVAKPAE